MPNPSKKATFSSALIFICGISAIGLLVTRDQTLLLFMAYFSAFFAYFWLSRFELPLAASLPVGLIARLILFLGLPTLSDDIFRFIWDGHLLAGGINPFEQLPGYYLAPDHSVPGLTPELYELLNSKGYFTIYPPLNQLVFWLSVTLGGDSWLLSTAVIRGLLLLADIGSFFLLRTLLKEKEMNPHLANWYWLNPLVILEFTGNVHFEGLVIFFILAGLWLIARPARSGLLFGLAIATKLLPMIYLPALLFRYKFKKGVTITGVAFAIAVLSLLPLLDSALISGLTSSLELYFRKFEFNASVYYVVRWFGYLRSGYNLIGTIGPVLSFIALLSILEIAMHGRWRSWELEKTLLYSLSIYLLLATTVHPWYILPLIVFGLLSGYYYPIVWSLMIFVTYFGYTKDGYSLPMYWVALEYLVVLSVFVVEVLKELEVEEH